MSGWINAANTPDCYRRLYELCQSGQHPHGTERRVLWQAVKQSHPDSFLAWQLATVVRWSAPDYLEVNTQFTPLNVNIKVQENPQTPAERQQIQAASLDEAMDIVFAQHAAPATVLLAPPGGGKSTLMRHYHLQQALRLDSIDHVVFYAQLRDYYPDKTTSQSTQSLAALHWLQAQWQAQTQNAPPLEDFIHAGKLTLLLDGLNEIPHDNPNDYQQRVQDWRDLIHYVESNSYPVRLLFSCRPLDYSQRIDTGHVTLFPEVHVQAMEPEQIRSFINIKYQQQPNLAQQVWDQLKEHPSFELYSSPYYLNLLLQQISADTKPVTIPDNRAALFSGMVKARILRECQSNPQSHLHNPDILSPLDRTALFSGNTSPVWLPEDTELFIVLAELAYHIQEQATDNERWGKLRWKEAVRIAGKVEDDSTIVEQYLLAACDLGLFEDDAAQARELRFVHQLMQEYFAAWVLAQRADASKVNSAWRSAEMTDSTATLLAQGGDDNLPELPTTGWEETTLMAANLMDKPDAFINEMMQYNLPLAGRCAAQLDIHIEPTLFEQLRSKLRQRCIDPEADLRARILAGKALGELGDPERLTKHVSAQHCEYLLPKFVTIPADNYRIGGDEQGFPALESAKPIQVELQNFEIAIHPVTNAEFAAFIKDGGYQTDAYWSGLALAWRNGEIGEEATRDVVRTDIQTVLDAVGKTATPEQIKTRFTYLSMAFAKWFHERLVSSDAELEQFLLETYPPASGIAFTQPAYWRSQQWSNPAQPVVCVCWYEAVAYCRWLTAQSQCASVYRLPTEAEWEAAGRGKRNGQRYPWQGEFDALKANTAETRLGVTTPVGIFDQGRSTDYQLDDLAGNVWEWTATPWSDPDHWKPTEGENDGDFAVRRVVRGGSWYDTGAYSRLGSRFVVFPDGRGYVRGFRVCRASPIESLNSEL